GRPRRTGTVRQRPVPAAPTPGLDPSYAHQPRRLVPVAGRETTPRPGELRPAGGPILERRWRSLQGRAQATAVHAAGPPGRGVRRPLAGAHRPGPGGGRGLLVRVAGLD